jgi:hypothetical protein
LTGPALTHHGSEWWPWWIGVFVNLPDSAEGARLAHARGALEIAFTLCPNQALETRPELVALALVNVRAAIRSLRARETSAAPEPDADTANEIEAALAREPGADFPASDRDRRDLELLAGYGRRLLRTSERPFVLARAARYRALLRRFGPGIAAATALACFGIWLASPRVISRGKPWATSSSAALCDPKHAQCGGAHTKILFHTNLENDPWFEIDLGKPYTVTGLSVRNRSDCCADRAVPLVAETSLDHVTYRILAHRFTEFERWEPRFDAVRARYVRVRVTRQSILHLDKVLVYGSERDGT